MVKVKIKTTVSTSQYGNLAPGEILSTSKEFADHLVNECAAAEYLTVDQSNKTEDKNKRPGSLLEKAKKLFK